MQGAELFERQAVLLPMCPDKILSQGGKAVLVLPGEPRGARRRLVKAGIDVPQQGDDARTLCWKVDGPHPLYVVLNTADNQVVRNVRDEHLASRTFVDMCHPDATVVVADDGRASLPCPQRACAVYMDADDYAVLQEAMRRRV